jgi:hypothetical protein
MDGGYEECIDQSFFVSALNNDDPARNCCATVREKGLGGSALLVVDIDNGGSI